jgi:exodeoxyribonuclease V gamma subunit
VAHPLQAFSSRYFDGKDARLFSYAAHYVGAARTVRYQAELGDFFPGPLASAPPADTLALSELVRFYRNPTAYLLQRRLELYLRDAQEGLSDREPLELSGLESYGVGQGLLELCLRGVPLEQARELVQARGALPLGAPGELDFVEIASCATTIASLVSSARQGGRQPPLTFQGRLPGGRVLFGTLNEPYPHGLVEQQFARVRAPHLLSLWIRHLGYCWFGNSGEDACSVLFGRPLSGDGAIQQRFRAVRDPHGLLEVLVRRFDEGQLEPLPLFPATSLAFARAQLGGDKRDPYAGLDKEWQLELQNDLHLQRVYGAGRSFAELRRRLPERFETLAAEVFGPLLEHLITEQHEGA